MTPYYQPRHQETRNGRPVIKRWPDGRDPHYVGRHRPVTS